MSNPNASMFVLSALAVFVLADNATASVSVVGGQLINERNQVVALRVASEPLAVDDADAVAAESVREVTFDAPPSVELNPAGEQNGRQVEVTASGLSYTVVHHGVFNVTRTATGFSIKAPANSTGRPISDQINVAWRASRILAVKAVHVTQNSMAKPKGQMAANLSRADASATDSTQLAELDASVADYDAAIRRRTGDGSNAVRIILSSADIGAGTVGTAFTRILQACQRQKVWCLLDPGPAAMGKAGTSDGVQYFVSEDVRAALLEHQDHVMLVLRESENAALGPRAAIDQLRAAGLPHVLIFSSNSLRTAAGGPVSAGALLETDGYQAVALAVDPGRASMDATSAVPVIEVAGVEPISAAADDSCTTVIKRGSTTVLELPCRLRVPRLGTVIDLPIGGSHGTVLVAVNKPWLTPLFITNQSVSVNVQVWLNPRTAAGRLGLLGIVTHSGASSVVWGFIDVVQSPR